MSVSVVVIRTETKALRILFPFRGGMCWSKEYQKNVGSALAWYWLTEKQKLQNNAL